MIFRYEFWAFGFIKFIYSSQSAIIFSEFNSGFSFCCIFLSSLISAIILVNDDFFARIFLADEFCVDSSSFETFFISTFFSST